MRAGLRITPVLARFVEEEVLPGTGVAAQALWEGFAALLRELAPRNRQLLHKRDRLQEQIDDWHRSRGRAAVDVGAEIAHLRAIGYLGPEPQPFEIETCDVDPELSTIPGPQLVVPVTNPRYVLNAANARWGSLYDALYGTDAIAHEPGERAGYDPARGARVIAQAKSILDRAAPLERASHEAVHGYFIESGQLRVRTPDGICGLQRPEQFAGYCGEPAQPTAILLRHHGLHIEIRIDRDHRVGAADAAGVADVVLESAVSTIVDFEDSVATVDAEDKTAAYRAWLGLMQGTLTARFDKSGRQVTRALNPDREFIGPAGATVRLRGRALLLVRNVGLHMYTDAVLDREGNPVPEGMLDAILTTLIALHDLRGPGPLRNSQCGSIYIVKPKLHGAQETELAVQTFAAVERILGLRADTVKIGLMDEERRTSANLASCIHAARRRLVFINTGFLDRTGDEIHTAMRAGAVMRKAEMRTAPWLEAYERRNVRIGLACGLRHRAQIGKGMWAAPDRMAAMLEQKITHPASGANTAWVPSPTAATLHAMHYHQVDVFARQEALRSEAAPDELGQLLQPPLAVRRYSPEEVREELENNAQGILGYVVRWIDQGVGCSKVPDIHDIGLMEDRATLRISSQHIANWLLHGIVSEQEVEDTLRRMATIVDRQNSHDGAYRPMAPEFDGPAFAAARALIFQGAEEPNGYTEAALQFWRRKVKALA